MSKFIKYENVDFKIENTIFYSSSVQISLKSNIQPVLLSDGTLLRYAPESSVVGSLSAEFYLNTELINALFPLSNSEAPFYCSFAGVSIDNCYINSLSFSVDNFSPVLVTIDADWYGKININNSFKPTTLKSRNSSFNEIAHANQSYIIEDDKNKFGFTEIFNFSYSEKCARIPFFELGESVPFRVMKADRQKSLEIKGNYINSETLPDDGIDSEAVINLKTLDGNLINTFSITGKINAQNISASQDGILESSISINQTVAPSRQEISEANSSESLSYIAMWGDSMVNLMFSNNSMTTALSNLNIDRRTVNKGVNGETALGIGTRQGGVAVSGTIASNIIPADTSSVAVTISYPTFEGSNYFLAGTSDIPVQINNVIGTLTRTSTTPTYTFARSSAGSQVSVTNPVRISPYYIDSLTNENLNKYTSIFWLGTNGSGSVNLENKEIIRGMINSLPVEEKKVLILPMFGQTGYSYYLSNNYWRLQNEEISDEFPEYWFDARSLFLTGAKDFVNANSMTWTADDEGAVYTSGNIPPVLASDNTHLNASGYYLYCSILANRIQELNW